MTIRPSISTSLIRLSANDGDCNWVKWLARRRHSCIFASHGPAITRWSGFTIFPDNTIRLCEVVSLCSFILYEKCLLDTSFDDGVNGSWHCVIVRMSELVRSSGYYLWSYSSLSPHCGCIHGQLVWLTSNNTQHILKPPGLLSWMFVLTPL